MKLRPIVALATLIGCGSTTPSAPVAVPALTVKVKASPPRTVDCKSLLDSALENRRGDELVAGFDAPMDYGLPPEVAELVAAEALWLKLRANGNSVCIASKSRRWCGEDQAYDDDCFEDAVERTDYAVGVVGPDGSLSTVGAAVAMDFDLDRAGILGWKVVAISPDEDGLALSRYQESGDSAWTDVEWYAVSSGRLESLLGYSHGHRNSELVEASLRVLDRVSGGHFVIELTVAEGSEMDGGSLEPKTSICTFDNKYRSYSCNGPEDEDDDVDDDQPH